ncbi:hypothetical protein BU25DRAFT_424157 [Macroventuria anomochaeta]|uniref:Uncharacterized protein n=1 Tax=Macroventuria anomochaeta TaxID=301207 RepID=A0ACB6RRP9_9PLEO|nr:uncharacterized protein BU25DRAFT_424157 [Macroventuria anomochaeta]KAF2624377.1 hypothetical protein BU25DRAFT_424157 [Macroventuria anomochaeta]
MFAYLQQLHESLYFPSDFFFGLEYITTRTAGQMPSRSKTIRRCAFKLPKNNKYQCQKAGDKYQPKIKLWYCRFHDRHAQDRCPVPVTWAGRGAQCGQLGHLDEESGKKLCERHAMKSKGDGWPQMRDVPSTERQDSLKGKHVEHVDAQIDAESNAPSDIEDVPLGSELHEQMVPPKDDCIQAEMLTDDKHRLATLKLEEPTFIAPEEESGPTPTAIIDAHALDYDAFLGALPKETLDKLTIRKTPGEPRDLGRPPRMRVDSLFPSPTSTPLKEDTAISSPTATAHAAYRDVVQSLGNTRLQIVPPRRTPQARIDFLSAQDAQSPTHIAATYVQCCVCLEKHGEYNMRQVESCKHRYRDLCFRKAVKIGGLRRFNCSSCRAWMEGRQKEMNGH